MSALITRHYLKEPIAQNTVVKVKKQRVSLRNIFYSLSYLKCKVELLFSKVSLGIVNISFVAVINKRNQNFVFS